MKIEIGNVAEKKYLLFDNFKREADFDTEEQKFITAVTSLYIEVATFRMELTFELSDFELLESNLSKMQHGIFKTFYFSHLDDRISLKFNISMSGTILVDGKIADETYTNYAKFALQLDQSYIPRIIMQLKEVIGKLKKAV